MSSGSDKTNAPWLTATAEYEGLPLALRVRPNANRPENRAKFPRLLLASHELAEVSSNGLPVATYNDALTDFDYDIHAAIEQAGAGLVVLIETFCGKRNYYAYVGNDGAARQRVEELQERYPQHKLSVRGSADPGWALYNDYRQRFPW